MLWFSSASTLIGMALVLHGRRYDLATQGRLEEREGPTVMVGLGILCMFVGGCLGLLTSLSLVG